MTKGNEIGKAICSVLAEIAAKEKTKAIQNEDYGDVLVATIFEGLFKQAERSFS